MAGIKGRNTALATSRRVNHHWKPPKRLLRAPQSLSEQTATKHRVGPPPGKTPRRAGCGWPVPGPAASHLNRGCECRGTGSRPARCWPCGRPRPSPDLLACDCPSGQNHQFYTEIRATTLPPPPQTPRVQRKAQRGHVAQVCGRRHLPRVNPCLPHQLQSLSGGASQPPSHELISLLQAKYENDNLR